MKNKLLLIGLGTVLIFSGFFIGMNYKKTAIDTVKNDVVDVVPDETLPTLDSLLATSKLYSRGENRTISPIKNIEEKISLGLVYEIKTAVDQENDLAYRIYRVGQGDVPPTYSEGRIFLKIIDSSNQPRYVWNLFDTQIDRVEPLGEMYVRKGKLIITCAKTQNISPAEPCEYQITYSSEDQTLNITRGI